ncbi:MAG TPA: alpha/beta hydrolase [Solirubrobacteraceae bacterium]|nr:alpha/beta hydrolase [Solirubrobacteraceae bacterium]
MTPSRRTIEDIEFASIAGARLRLDLHRPAGDAVVPCVVYFHGGGWARGSRKDNVTPRLAPVVGQGLAVCSVSYRLTDVATHPAQVEDGRAALGWLRANGAGYGLRTDRIGAWGASAGGWIALMLALTGEDPAQRADAACAWFPPTDLEHVTPEREAAALRLPAFMQGHPVPDMEARLLGLRFVRDDPALARQASPLTHAARSHGPVLLIHGDADGLINVSQSRRLHRALLAAGGDSELLVVDGANHEDGPFHRPAILSATGGFLLASLSAR